MAEVIAKRNPIKRSRADVIFDICNYLGFAVIIGLVLYPLYFVLIASVSNPDDVLLGKVVLFPTEFQFQGYQLIFRSGKIWLGYVNTIIYTTLGTSLSIVLTMMAGYALSRHDFLARRIILFIFVVTMYFSGGLVPTYMVVDRIGLADNWLVMVVLGAVSVWSIIITRTFLSGDIYVELRDAAQIDGCDDFYFLFRIVFPLAKALIAVLSLQFAIGHWNSYMTALIYLKDSKQYPLQMVLREILITSNVDLEMFPDIPGMEEKLRLNAVMKYGLVVVASAPLLIIYPFLQKYFVKGVTLGSLKG